mgnify:CR=1 FL=1|jgi:hypothetical protein
MDDSGPPWPLTHTQTVGWWSHILRSEELSLYSLAEFENCEPHVRNEVSISGLEIVVPASES